AVPKQCAVMSSAANKFKAMGASVDYIEIPFFDYAVAAYYIIATAEASSNLSRFDGVKYGYKTDNYGSLAEMYRKTRSEGFGSEVKKRILLGTFVLSSGYYDAYYKKALKIKELVKNNFSKLFEEYDFILTPTTVSSAPKPEELKNDSLRRYTDDIYTVPVNLAGLPAVSFPYGKDENGMPLGAQLIGQRLSDAKLLKTAKAFTEVVR
ncbi:MAG: Asp-tRNA(Asn)/Glu-tRNA(Gln) amidotransferase subunit GatA, partial [Clostridia bacterium]|nr:Asp-tRNA(Asn)/Glu-tRNA(Gln) amidotransferase subunit GatA [Clostridia bacterium]